jgi:uncharacterized membrane protein
MSIIGLAAVCLGLTASARWPNVLPFVIIGSLMTGPAMLIVLALALAPLNRIDEELRALGGGTALGTHSDGWRWGGLIYFAPDDPALVVPKRIGIGQTLNFARPAAWSVLIGILVVVLLVALVPALL